MRIQHCLSTCQAPPLNLLNQWNLFLHCIEIRFNIGFGTIDAGEYTMVSRQISDSIIYPIINQIASSALGYMYEDANGNINYADASHRQDYLIANGYTDLDASHAIASGIGVIQRQGDLSNKIIMDYGNNFNNSYTAQDLDSQAKSWYFDFISPRM